MLRAFSLFTPAACALLLSSFVACSGGAPSSGANADGGASAPDATATSPTDGSAAADGGSPVDAAHDGASPVDASHGGPQDSGVHPSPDAGLFEDAGADDPGLSNPGRPSFPFECQGTPMSVSDMIEHFPLATDYDNVENGRNWNNTADVFTTAEYGRTCTPQTGCSAWAPWGSPSPTSYYLWLHVDGSGVVSLDQIDWHGDPVLGRIVPAGEFQMVMGGIDDGVNPKPPATRYEVRIVRNPDGSGCVSAASLAVKDPPAANGSTFEHFMVGVAALPVRVPIPRPAPAPRTAWTNACQGTPAEDSVIGGWFAPGSSMLSFSSANATSRVSTQSCHPITGCTEWSYATLPIWRLWGIETNGSSGFALRIDSTPPVPIVHGVPSGTVSGASYSGLAATSGCVSYDAKELVPTANSSVVTETHTEEQNKAF